jgi:hypothetical protein
MVTRRQARRIMRPPVMTWSANGSDASLLNAWRWTTDEELDRRLADKHTTDFDRQVMERVKKLRQADEHR